MQLLNEMSVQTDEKNQSDKNCSLLPEICPLYAASRKRQTLYSLEQDSDFGLGGPNRVCCRLARCLILVTPVCLPTDRLGSKRVDKSLKAIAIALI